MKSLIHVLTFVCMLSQFNCTTVLHTNGRTSDGEQAKQVNFKAPAKGATTVISNALYHNDATLNAALISPAPLPNGFAHNDYLHPHPLRDALENGFTNIEADIFLKNDKLIVAHIFPYFKGHKTLESLYLQPLLDRITKNGGQVFRGYNSPVTLLIDIKTNGNKTYTALKPLLEKYRSILSEYQNGKMIYRAVTVVLSGHKPYSIIEHEQNRLAFIDEDLYKVPCDSVNNNEFAMASCKYSDILTWNGDGNISNSERNTLRAFVAMAHKMRVKVRLWASPERKEVWDMLLSCGVDLINTDKLTDLKSYLTVHTIAKVD